MYHITRYKCWPELGSIVFRKRGQTMLLGTQRPSVIEGAKAIRTAIISHYDHSHSDAAPSTRNEMSRSTFPEQQPRSWEGPTDTPKPKLANWSRPLAQ